jgi:hypothetical protein
VHIVIVLVLHSIYQVEVTPNYPRTSTSCADIPQFLQELNLQNVQLRTINTHEPPGWPLCRLKLNRNRVSTRELLTLHTLPFQAKRIPPLVPSAGSTRKQSKSALRVDITILWEIASFLVSCKQTISGLVELITHLTTSHLASRFSPLTFHINFFEGSIKE